MAVDPSLYVFVTPAREEAALPAGGAFDAAPLEMPCSGMKNLMLFIEYTRGGVGGDMQFKLEFSPVSSGDHWYQGGITAAGAVASGSDTLSNTQRQAYEYGSTGAPKEKVMCGPVSLGQVVERVRVVAKETGAVATPGTCKITAAFA